jgi:hypothetical protein
MRLLSGAKRKAQPMSKQPTFDWGYRPDSTVQENPYPYQSALWHHWDATKAAHDLSVAISKVEKGAANE